MAPLSRAARTRLRLAVGLCASTAVAASLAGWAFVSRASTALDRLGREALDRRVGAVGGALDEVRRDLGLRLADAEGRLGRDPSLVARILAGGPRAVDAAERLAPAGVDSLWIRDERGRVVSASHWPQLAGVDDPLGTGVADGSIVPVPSADGSRLSVVAVRRFRTGEREIALVAGRALDASFLDRVAGGDAAVLYDPGSASPSWTEGAALDLGRTASRAAGGASVRYGGVRGRDGSPWLAAAVPLGDGGGAVVLAVDAGRLADLRRRLVRFVVLLGCAAAGAAALVGWWLGGRVARPVGRLARAVDAIAAGEADYTFSAPREDEVEELAEAFSRLKRSLDAQIARSRAAERVATWKEIAQRVAHEVKNPLVPIRLTLENLRRVRSREPRLFDEMFDDGVRTMLEEVDQLSRLVGEFSEFARLPPPRPGPVDVHALIDETLALFSSEPDLAISRDYAPGVPPLLLDADQMRRVLKNVVGNAVEAMRDGPRRDRPLRLEVRSSREDGMILIEILDSGPGLPRGRRGRIFEPHFTTKPGGAGLGMAITHRIVSEHGGWIAAADRPAGGTCIAIRLPVPGAKDG